MELNADATEYIPKYLYIVKVKNKSDYEYLSEVSNKPEDVIVIKKVPNKKDGEPNFSLGLELLYNIKGER